MTSNVKEAAPPEILAQVTAALARLEALVETPPCLVVLGERNSGKTTVANALIGGGILPASVIANTRYPTLVRFAEQTELFAVSGDERHPLADAAAAWPSGLDYLEVGIPHSPLQAHQVLDTPGDMAPDTALALPLSAPVRIPLWCTLATQAWKASERAAWHSVDQRRRRFGVLVVTGCDRVNTDEFQGLAARIEADAAPFFRAVAYSPSRSDGSAHELIGTVGRIAADVADRRRRAARRIRERYARFVPGPPG